MRSVSSIGAEMLLFEVVSQKAKVENGAIKEYRATIEVTFVLD